MRPDLDSYFMRIAYAVSDLPCINCTKALINAGISRIVYKVDENVMNFLKAEGIEVAHKEFTAFA